MYPLRVKVPSPRYFCLQGSPTDFSMTSVKLGGVQTPRKDVHAYHFLVH